MISSPEQLIKQAYIACGRGDATSLFRVLLSVAEKVGHDEAFRLLEQCVLEKRLAWYEAVGKNMARMGNPIADGYHLFYERYLGVKIPDDGEIAEVSGRKLILRWWNPCPTLEACLHLGLDTREVCRKVYHAPVQALLSLVDPRLRFDRNYAALRPYTPYCEEMITLAEAAG